MVFLWSIDFPAFKISSDTVQDVCASGMHLRRGLPMAAATRHSQCSISVQKSAVHATHATKSPQLLLVEGGKDVYRLRDVI